MGTSKEAIYYELLVLRCRRKAAGAMEELIKCFEKRLFYYVRRLVDSEEETWGIMQQIWIKVIRSIKHLKEPKSLPAWLYSIARNTAISHLRSNYRRKLFSDCVKEISDIEDKTEDFSFDDAEQVHYGLSKISLPQRDVMTLYFLQDLSLKEIADVLGVSIGTVKSRLHYAKQALKAVLEQEGGQNE